MKYIRLGVLFVLGVGLVFQVLAYTQVITPDLLNNYFKLDLGRGNKATLYFTNDHTLVFMPPLTNTEYVHICWARWRLNEKKQMLKISGANDCRFLRGDYTIYKRNETFHLKDGPKNLWLQVMQDR